MSTMTQSKNWMLLDAKCSQANDKMLKKVRNIFFSPLIPSKRETNILVLLS